MWLFKTKFGTLRIEKLPNSRYGLYLEDELLGSYHSAEAAAEIVYSCTTGHDGWDGGGPVVAPKDLTDWQYFSA